MNMDFLIGIFVFATIIGQVRLCQLMNMHFLIGIFVYAVVIGQVRLRHLMKMHFFTGIFVFVTIISIRRCHPHELWMNRIVYRYT